MRWLVALMVMGWAAPAVAAPPPLEAYVRLPAIADASVSPTGDRFAILSHDKGRPVEGLWDREWLGAAILNLKTGKSYVLFGASRTFMDAIFAWRGSARIDGRWYGYVEAMTWEAVQPSFHTKTIYPDLYRVDL